MAPRTGTKPNAGKHSVRETPHADKTFVALTGPGALRQLEAIAHHGRFVSLEKQNFIFATG
jgi:hypothetical protein